MTIKILEPLAITFNGQRTPYSPGDVVTLPYEAGRKLLERAPDKVRIVAIEVGATIAWEGADLCRRTGIVDFFHHDAGVLWAFVTLPDGGWAAVNVKFARLQALEGEAAV